MKGEIVLSALMVVGWLTASVQTNKVLLADSCPLPAVVPDDLECLLSDGVTHWTVPGQNVPHGTICTFEACYETVQSICGHDGNWQGNDLHLAKGNCGKEIDVANGETGIALNGDKEIHPRPRRKRFFGLIAAAVVWCVVTSCLDRKPKDTTPPTFQNCPADINDIADPGQFNTKVFWKEPTAYDNGNQIGWRRSGLGPGKLFNGSTKIQYVAIDNSGNRGYCRFTIKVTVKYCRQLGSITDGYKFCAPSTYMMYGTWCRFGCYPGHEILGPSSVRCLITEKWTADGPPTCVKKKCPLEPNNQVGIRNSTCTDENYYRSICTFSCIQGYGILPGSPVVQVCAASGSWKGAKPVCVDTEAPQFTSCHTVLTFYADKSTSETTVDWTEPVAQDNGGTVEVKWTSGPKPGTTLSVGVYEVEYEAKDSTGNTETCSFKVVVKQIRCYTISPLPYSSVTCPYGTRYGALCEFTCDNGTTLSGQQYTTCEKKGTDYPYGYWSFSNHQPYCTVEVLCPDLEPPVNGALACDLWKSGPLCIPMCQEGYYFPVEYKGNHSLLTCEGSNGWRLETDLTFEITQLPACGRVSDRVVRYVKANAYFYFNGSCEEVKDEIKENFEIALRKTNFYLSNCIASSSCSINNIEVECGQQNATARKKRSDDDESGLVIIVVFLLGPTDVTYGKAELGKMRHDLYGAVTTAGNSEDVQGVSGVIYKSTDFSPITIECVDGFEANMDSLTCVQCSVGYYHDASTKKCLKCPRGQYQENAGSTVCKTCPETMTTLEKGATSAALCIETCGQGYFSNSGALPCTPCHPGTYASTHGTTTCTPCPGSQITQGEGATSVSQCYEFDVVIQSGANGSAVLIPVDVSQDVDSVYASFWLRCSLCQHIFGVASESGILFELRHENSLQMKIQELVLESQSSPTDGRWHNIQILINTTHVRLVVDNSENVWDRPLELLSSGVFSGSKQITVGDGGFAGSVSQLQMWSYESPNLQLSSTSCYISGQGDLVAWRSVSELDLGDAFVQRSGCDDFNDCTREPCIHGICTDGLNTYTCDCHTGFTGEKCDINIDDCHGNACDNGATCVDGDNSYSCHCTAGFGGDLCEIKIVDGGYGVWSNWSECSATCGDGTRTRYRACDSPPPDNGGKQCLGEDTESETCNEEQCVYECDKLPTVINGDSNCTQEDEDWTCRPYCNEGYDFDRPLPLQVVCGTSTNNRWNVVNDDNPTGDLPMCTEMKVPERNSLHYSGIYPGLACEHDNSNAQGNIENTFSSKIQQLACISEGKCSHKATDIEECDGSTRKKRSTGVKVTVQMSCESTTAGLEDCLETLIAAFNALQTFVESLSFTVTKNGVQYNIDLNSTTAAGGAECLNGEIPVKYYCIPCGYGTFQQFDECVPCYHGFYQDTTGQMDCKQCPARFTTTGRGARSISQCVVPLPAPTSELYWIIGVVAAFVLISTAVIALLVIRYHRAKATQTTTENCASETIAQAADGPHNSRFDARKMKSGATPEDEFEFDNEAFELRPVYCHDLVNHTPPAKEKY